MGRSYRFVSLRNIPSGGRYKWADARSGVAPWPVQAAPPPTSAYVCAAISSSSSVGTTATATRAEARRNQPGPAARARRSARRRRPAPAPPDPRSPPPAPGRSSRPTPGGEGHGVHPAEHRVVGADVLLQPVDVDVEGQPRRSSPSSIRRPDLPHVVVAAQAEQPAPLVEQGVDLVRGHSRHPLPGGRPPPGRCHPSGCPSPAPPAGSAPSRCPRTRPPRTADAEAPLPRCSTMTLTPRGACPAARRSRGRRTRARCRGSRSGGCGARRPSARRSRSGPRTPASSCGRRCRRPRPAAGRGAVPRAVRMPVRFAGLCSGASGTSCSISARTASSITVGSVNGIPPCTTRWPIAASSGESRPSPSAASSAATAFSAASWSATSPADSRVSPAAGSGCAAARAVSPIRSTSPTASRALSAHVQQLVLHRRRAGVEDEDAGGRGGRARRADGAGGGAVAVTAREPSGRGPGPGWR